MNTSAVALVTSLEHPLSKGHSLMCSSLPPSSFFSPSLVCCFLKLSELHFPVANRPSSSCCAHLLPYQLWLLDLVALPLMKPPFKAFLVMMLSSTHINCHQIWLVSHELCTHLGGWPYSGSCVSSAIQKWRRAAPVHCSQPVSSIASHFSSS